MTLTLHTKELDKYISHEDYLPTNTESDQCMKRRGVMASLFGELISFYKYTHTHTHIHTKYITICCSKC